MMVDVLAQRGIRGILGDVINQAFYFTYGSGNPAVVGRA